MTGKAFHHRAFNNAGVMILGSQMSGNSQVALTTLMMFPRPGEIRGLGTTAHLLPSRVHLQHPGHSALPLGAIPTSSGAWMEGQTAGRWARERRDEQSLAPSENQPKTPCCRRETLTKEGTSPPCAPRCKRSHFTHPGHQKGQLQSHQGCGLRNNSWLMSPF